jgi:hypothetical protein
MKASPALPAISAHLGLVDRLFSRVGAADDLARGHSTFMVEMASTAMSAFWRRKVDLPPMFGPVTRRI